MIERSDVIVQIVDARNPLLFRCLDLVRYRDLTMDLLQMDESSKTNESYHLYFLFVLSLTATLRACFDKL